MTLSIYGLISNFSWGLIFTTLISFYISIISFRDLIQYSDMIQYADYTFVINQLYSWPYLHTLSQLFLKKSKK